VSVEPSTHTLHFGSGCPWWFQHVHVQHIRLLAHVVIDRHWLGGRVHTRLLYVGAGLLLSHRSAIRELFIDQHCSHAVRCGPALKLPLLHSCQLWMLAASTCRVDCVHQVGGLPFYCLLVKSCSCSFYRISELFPLARLSRVSASVSLSAVAVSSVAIGWASRTPRQ
jgi:hypothetical protein